MPPVPTLLLIPTAEVQARQGDQSERVLDPGLQAGWLRDLPLCFPNRACYDVPPGGAQALYLIADLTPASPWIAALIWAGLGASLVLIVTGLRRYWREARVQPSLVLIATGLIVGGAIVAWSTSAWLGEAAVVYGGADGRPAGPTPLWVISAWPQVRSAAQVALVLGAVVVVLVLNITAVHRRRALRVQTSRSD